MAPQAQAQHSRAEQQGTDDDHIVVTAGKPETSRDNEKQDATRRDATRRES